jgi:hypothetical protein
LWRGEKDMNNKLKQRISKRWSRNQEENEDAYQRPHTDLGNILVALGAILILIGILIRI